MQYSNVATIRRGLLSGEVPLLNESFLHALFGDASVFAGVIWLYPQSYSHSGPTKLFGFQWGVLEPWVIFIMLLLFLGLRGRYTSRLPLWSDLKVLAPAVSGALFADVAMRLSFWGRIELSSFPFHWLLFAAGSTVVRKLGRRLLSRTEQWSLNTIIIDPCNAAEIAQRVLQANPDLGYNVVSVADWHDLQEEASSGGAWATLPRHVSAAVVPVFRDALPGRITAPAWSAALSLPATVYGMSITGDFSRYVDGREITLFTFRAGLPRPMALVAKEVVDRVVASVLLLLTAPVFLIVITLVSLDGGPAFFGHARVGFGGRPFKCLKFRTMVPSAEAVLQEFLANNPEAEQEWASSRKLRVDPRVTRVGAWLRKTSIDELPQLLNVLRGEMSLVGPRPIVIEEMEKYGDNIVYYTSVNPGITGLWQVSGRSNLDYARRVALDTNYVKYWKFRHDIKILLRTVPAVLMKDGAC